VAADTTLLGEFHAPAAGFTPMSSEDWNMGNPPPSAPAADPTVLESDPEEPAVDTADVSIDAVEVVPEAKLVAAATVVLDVVVVDALETVDAVNAERGVVTVEDDVAVDAAACRAAVGAALVVSGATTCAVAPTGVAAACVTAAAIPAPPPPPPSDEVVVSGAGVNGVTVVATDDAPAYPYIAAASCAHISKYWASVAMIAGVF
jgi:hypothetical protein